MTNNATYYFLLISAFLLCLVHGNFLSDDNIMSGVMFPERIVAKEGSDINLKLENPFQAPQICNYRIPKSNTVHEIGNDPRITRWNGERCGILVKNVSLADEGFWMLSSKRDNDFVRGVLMVNIIPKIDTEMEETVDYCVVSRPDQLSFPQIGDCKLPEDMPGDWKLHKGMRGQNMEVIEEFYHEAKVEKLSTMIDKQSGAIINLLCKLENSDRQIKACRFLRVADNYALNVDDGLGSDNLRFYGKGLMDGECGITIENVRPVDRGLWKCFVTTVTKGEKEKEKSFGQILDASDSPTSLRLTYPGRQALINGSESKITCNANLAIDYCWFRKPDGQILSVSDKMMDDSDPESDSKEFSYHGLGFGLGECGISLKNVKPEDAGQWRCSAGTSKAGFEAQQIFQVDVRTTMPFIVADLPRFDVNQGDSFRIECRTISSHLPLEQCHFVTPSGTGFSIDETVTQENSLGVYYFSPNRKMRSGWCSLVVKRARKEHQGIWQCLAKSSTWDMEGMDEINVQVRVGISIASGVGGAVIAVFAIAMFTISGIVIMERRKRKRIVEQNRQLQEEIEEQRRISQISTSSSNNSGIELQTVR